MAASGGHWTTLAEAEKLTQAIRVPGVMEEDIKRGGLIGRLPVWQLRGLRLEWLREAVVAGANRASVGSTLVWSEETTYQELNVPLKIVYKQTVLNNFIESVYGTFNNYRNIQAFEDRKSVIRQLEDDLIYGDVTFGGSNQPDGLHALAQASPQMLNAGSNTLNIDEGEAGLQLINLRKLEIEMKHGIDFFLFPQVIASRLDAYVQENAPSTAIFGQIQFSVDEVGKRVTMWNGIPIIRSDYLVAENANTGVGSDIRAKHNTGTAAYSVFAIKMGQVARKEPGITWVFGGTPENMQQGSPIMTTFFDRLEDFDAKGLRQVAYHAMADGSSGAIGRIYDINDAAVIV